MRGGLWKGVILVWHLNLAVKHKLVGGEIKERQVI